MFQFFSNVTRFLDCYFLEITTNSNFLAVVVSGILGGPKFTLGGPAPPPPDASIGKILTHLQVLAYTIITVKFQLRVAPLTSALSIIGFALKCPQNTVLGVGEKIFGGKVHPSLELRVFRHLWSRSDAPYSSIL